MQALFHLLKKIESLESHWTSIARVPMGFDIHIQVIFYMCSSSGKPYYFKRNRETKLIEKKYDFPDFIVPEALCKYLVGRGHLFHAYTEYFNDQERYCVPLEEFLERYPSWEEVVDHENYSDEGGWTEDDHLGFLDLLKWCSKQDVSFEVSWSY